MPNKEFPHLLQQVKRAMKLTAELNSLVTDDVAEVRTAFSRLIGREVDESFLLDTALLHELWAPSPHRQARVRQLRLLVHGR